MPMVSSFNFYQVAWSALSSHMRRNLLLRGRQNGWLVAVSLGIFILLSHLIALPVLAQDLDLDLPQESGPAGARPSSVAPGKPAADAKPEETSKAEAAPEAPQETPQVEYKRKPLKEAISKTADRLLHLRTGDLGINGAAIIGRAQLSTENIATDGMDQSNWRMSRGWTFRSQAGFFCGPMSSGLVRSQCGRWLDAVRIRRHLPSSRRSNLASTGIHGPCGYRYCFPQRKPFRFRTR